MKQAIIDKADKAFKGIYPIILLRGNDAQARIDGDIDFLQGHEFSYDTVKNMTWRQLAKILKEHAHFDVIEIFQDHTQFIGSRSEVNYKKKVKSDFGAPKKAECKAAPKRALIGKCKAAPIKRKAKLVGSKQKRK